jgi:transposase-like protein
VTWVSLMIFEGHTVVEVARQAGHSAETCRHYARVFKEYDPADCVNATDRIRRARETIANERQVGKQLGLDL